MSRVNIAALERLKDHPEESTVGIVLRTTFAERERFKRGADLDGQSLNQWCLEAIRCWCDSTEEYAREEGRL
jgi:hypothetical protein